MREPMSLDAAAHRAGLNVSLFEVILDMALKEDISAVLYDLISIACDTNSEIRRALIRGLAMMHDIYNALLNFELEKKSDEDLREYSNTCSDATHGIFCALRLIGSMAVMANANEDYDADDAKRDLFLLGTVLQQLPRMAEALEQNSQCADYVLRQRKEVAK